MPTNAGVGHSERTISFDAGREAAQAAMAHAAMDRCTFAMLFASAPHDPISLRDGVRSVIGSNARLFGASAPGVITNDYLGYTGSQVGVAVLSSDSATFDVFAQTGLRDAEHDVGLALARTIKSKSYVDRYNVLVLYDAVKQPARTGRAEMNFATPLIEGLSEELKPWPPFAGCGSLSDPGFVYPSVQFHDDDVLDQSAIAFVSSGQLRMDTAIMHGTRPASGYHTITKAEGNVIFEIDAKPALDVVTELLGPDSALGWEDYPLLITFGVNKGGKFNAFEEENYANRLCLAVDKEHRALIMFEPDLKAGAEVQLMRRSIDFRYIKERTDALLERLGRRRPVFAFYIDCIGRCAAYSGMEKEEAAELQAHIGSRMPLLGIYSGVEIAKVGNDMQPLDWTGVLCVFSE